MKFRIVLPFATLALSLFLLPVLNAAESFSEMNVSAAKTPLELHALVERLNSGSVKAIKNNTFTKEIQEGVLQKAADCIDKAVLLHGQGSPEAAGQEKAVFLLNREVLKRIIGLNQKILDDYQEKLDNMENPLAFFQTPSWRQPEQLAATANFRLGWNDYYAGLLFPQNDGTGKQLFTEAVESFSRSFASAKEDKMLISSLWGRALCYRRLQLFKEALQDLKSVKGTIKKNDLLYLRSCYEETVIASLTGKTAEVLRKIDQIEKDYPATKIPEELQADLKRLKESALHAVAEKAAGKGGELPAPGKQGP